MDSACPHSHGLGVPQMEAGMRPRAMSVLGTPVPARAPPSLSSLFGTTVSPACPVMLGGLSRCPAASAEGWTQTQPGLWWAGGGKPAAGRGPMASAWRPENRCIIPVNCDLVSSALAPAGVPAIHLWLLATQRPQGAGLAPRPSGHLLIKQSLQKGKP